MIRKYYSRKSNRMLTYSPFVSFYIFWSRFKNKNAGEMFFLRDIWMSVNFALENFPGTSIDVDALMRRKNRAVLRHSPPRKTIFVRYIRNIVSRFKCYVSSWLLIGNQMEKLLSHSFQSLIHVRVQSSPHFHVIKISWVDVAKNKSDPNFFASLLTNMTKRNF